MQDGSSLTLKSKPTLDLSWKGVQYHCDRICMYLQQVSIQFNLVAAIARGGLVPATCIAQTLGIRDVVAIPVSSYDKNGTPTYPPQFGCGVNEKYLRSLNSYSTILIDDIVDSGATMILLNQYMPLAVKCTIVAKTGAEKIVNFYGTEVARDVWVNFPWEK